MSTDSLQKVCVVFKQGKQRTNLGEVNVNFQDEVSFKVGHAESIKTCNEDYANIIRRQAVSAVLACWVSVAAKSSEISASHQTEIIFFTSVSAMEDVRKFTYCGLSYGR